MHHDCENIKVFLKEKKNFFPPIKIDHVRVWVFQNKNFNNKGITNDYGKSNSNNGTKIDDILKLFNILFYCIMLR